ncbi:hypothetical protein L1887_28580 [Cichorium endivia]|nr:hypothetical protein L1887_28580 [Cichorium endivia]
MMSIYQVPTAAKLQVEDCNYCGIQKKLDYFFLYLLTFISSPTVSADVSRDRLTTCRFLIGRFYFPNFFFSVMQKTGEGIRNSDHGSKPKDLDRDVVFDCLISEFFFLAN